MRVLQIVHAPDPGGVLTLAQTLADGLGRHGITVETVYLFDEISSGKLTRLGGALRAAGRILTGRYDGLMAYQATACIVVGTIGWLKGIPARIVHQTTQPSETIAPIRWLDRLVGALRLYPINVVNSLWTQSQFAGYPEPYRRSLRLIEHGVTTPVARRTRGKTWQAYGVPDDGPILLNTGRLADQKNQVVLIRALPRLPGVRLVIAGGGPLQADYQALAEELGVADRLHMLGAVPYADIADLYAAADLFVFPSVHETFGISAVEAALLRRPTVVADLVVLREVLTIDGASEAVFVEPHDIDGWRQAIATMLASPPPPERLAALAARIADRFSEAKMIGRYVDLLRQLCPGRPTRPA